MPLTDRISFLVHRINAHLLRVTKPLLKRWGIDLTESRLLVAILEQGEMSAGDIVSTMALPQSTVSHQLKRLEKLGYIVREPTPDDQRRIMARLTETGRQVAKEGNALSRSVTDVVFHAIGADDIEMVRRAMKRVDQQLAKL
ncbi:hypothetical protein B2G71_17155 [Novosphingobium sp. PC22D]|nr:hypothetical protein B2G71_17155 [Novosphingobium sp. PC22D]